MTSSDRWWVTPLAPMLEELQTTLTQVLLWPTWDQATKVLLTSLRGRLFTTPYTGAVTLQFAAALGVT